MKEYKIVYLYGCSYSLEINGTEFVDLSREEQENICHTIIDDSRFAKPLKDRFVMAYVEGDSGLEFGKEDQDYVDRLYNDGKLDEECHAIINEHKCSESTMQQLVDSFAEFCGECEDFGYCDECGSFNYQYTIAIKTEKH